MRYFVPSYRMLLATILATFVQALGQAEPHHIRLPPDEIYTNKATQFQFPPKVAEFQREAGLTEYDPAGRDIGVGYNDLIHNIAATVFVYPIAQRPPNDDLKGHFETCKEEVVKKHAGAKLVEQGKVKVKPNGQNQEGLHAAFTLTDIFAHRRQPVRSELYLFTYRRSFVLFRVTYPAAQQATSEPVLNALLDGFPWP